MESQNYANHWRRIFLYHVILFFALIVTIIGSLVNFYESLGDHERLYSASLIVVLSICALMLYFFCRSFALRAQDRAIRSEENLRYFAITGKLLDPRLTLSQVIALRFASDEEFLELTKRAVEENLSNDSIKRAVKNWRADYNRV